MIYCDPNKYAIKMPKEMNATISINWLLSFS